MLPIISAAEVSCPIPIENLFPQKEIEKIFSRKLIPVNIHRGRTTLECRYGSLKIQMSVRKARKAPVSHIEAQKATCRDAINCVWEDGYGDGMWHPAEGRHAEAFCGDYSIFIESGASKNPPSASVQVIKLMKGKACPPAPVEEKRVVVPKAPAKNIKISSIKFSFEGKEIAKDKLPAGIEAINCDPAKRFSPAVLSMEVEGEWLKNAVVSINDPNIQIVDSDNRSERKMTARIRTLPTGAPKEYELLITRGTDEQRIKINLEISGTQYFVYHAKPFSFPIEFVGNWPVRPFDKEENKIAEVPRIETNIRLAMEELSGSKYKDLGLKFRAYTEECWQKRPATEADSSIPILADLPAVGVPLNIAKSILNQSVKKLSSVSDKNFHDKWNEIVNEITKPKPDDPKDKPLRKDPLANVGDFLEAVIFDPASSTAALKENDIAYNKKLKLLKEYGFTR